jgi:hypothetical protein
LDFTRFGEGLYGTGKRDFCNLLIKIILKKSFPLFIYFKDPRGGLINRWSLLPPEEELIILQQFLRFPITRPISLALIKEDFPSVVNVNNNVLGTSHPLTNIINNNNTNINSSSTNGNKHGKTSVSPQQSISPLHQLSSLGIHHSGSKGIQASGFSSLPAAGQQNTLSSLSLLSLDHD